MYGTSPRECSIGKSLQEECHKLKYSRKVGLVSIGELEEQARELLEIRTDKRYDADIYTICFHHKQKYITKYSDWQLQCCNPWKLHKKSVSYRSVKTIALSDTDKFNAFFEKSCNI